MVANYDEGWRLGSPHPLLRSGSGLEERATEHHQGAAYEDIEGQLHMLIHIEEGTINDGGFGLKQICGLAAGMRVTPYRLMLAYESKLRDAEKENREKA